jgi:hypothetical protein
MKTISEKSYDKLAASFAKSVKDRWSGYKNKRKQIKSDKLRNDFNDKEEFKYRQFDSSNKLDNYQVQNFKRKSCAMDCTIKISKKTCLAVKLIHSNRCNDHVGRILDRAGVVYGD